MSEICLPSQIGWVLPLRQKLIIKIIDTNEKTMGESSNFIDAFINGDYDDYEVVSIGTVKYGWLEIVLGKIQN